MSSRGYIAFVTESKIFWLVENGDWSFPLKGLDCFIYSGFKGQNGSHASLVLLILWFWLFTSQLWLVAKDFDFIPISFWSQCQMLLQRDYTTLGSILHSSLLCTTWTSLVPNPKELWIRPGNEARPEAEQLGNETSVTYIPGGRMQLCRLGYSCFLIWDWSGVLEPGYVHTWTHAFM